MFGMKKRSWKAYAFWIGLTEAVGALSAWLIRDGVKLYNATVRQPPLSPPSVVFPIVWAVLYALMGAAAARVYQSPASRIRSQGLQLYLVQLAFNFFWSLIFFNRQQFALALVWLLLLWLLILWTILAFRKTDRLSVWLLAPYLLWVSFAVYLNYGVWMLNRG